MSYYNKSHSLINYKSSQYEIPLKAPTKSAKMKVEMNKHNTSLPKYLPRTKTESKIKINATESKSLPKNLDHLTLPSTFFNEDHKEINNKNNKDPTAWIDTSQNPNVSVNSSIKFRLTDRGSSHSIDALQMRNQNKKILLQSLHCNIMLFVAQLLNNYMFLFCMYKESHIEYGICAALQYIVSYALHASKYLNIELLYQMGLYKKNTQGKFILHTYIQRKGEYFRLYWINTIQENMHNSNKNEQNIQNKKIKSRKSVIRKQKLGPLQRINNYGSQTLQTH